MSVNDEEVRKAAAWYRDSLTPLNGLAISELAKVDLLAQWAADELKRRDAEASARSKPIDDNLLNSLDFFPVDDDALYVEHRLLRGRFSFTLEGEFVWEHGVDIIMMFKTAGRLIDFIDMVKDGAP